MTLLQIYFIIFTIKKNVTRNIVEFFFSILIGKIKIEHSCKQQIFKSHYFVIGRRNNFQRYSNGKLNGIYEILISKNYTVNKK